MAKIKERFSKQDPNTIIQNIIGQNATKSQTALRRNHSENPNTAREIASLPKYGKNREETRNYDRIRN